MSSTRVVISSPSSSYRAFINPNAGYQENKFKLESLIVPETYYNFGTSQLVTFVDTSATVSELNFVIGSYTVDSFLTQLVNNMSFIDPFVNYTYQQNDISKKWEIVGDNPGTFELTLPDTISKYFGLGYTSNSLVSDSQIIILGVADFTRTKYFNLYSSQSIIGDGGYVGEGDNNIAVIRDPELIATVPLGNALSINQSNYYGDYGLSAKTGKIGNNWLISIRDEDGQNIDFNGHNWTMVIWLYSGGCNCN